MALVKKQMSRQRIAILVVLLAVIAGAALYVFVFQGSTTGGGSSIGDIDVERLRTTLQDTTKVDQDILVNLEKLLDDVRFQELKPFGEVPVEIGKTGRTNPFQQP